MAKRGARAKSARCPATDAMLSAMDQFRRNGLVFDVRDEGPADGPVVVLLHGFPQRNSSWDAIVERLTAQGYRCLAPNQRVRVW